MTGYHDELTGDKWMMPKHPPRRRKPRPPIPPRSPGAPSAATIRDKIVCYSPEQAATVVGILLGCMNEHRHDFRVMMDSNNRLAVMVRSLAIECLQEAMEKNPDLLPVGFLDGLRS